MPTCIEKFKVEWRFAALAVCCFSSLLPTAKAEEGSESRSKRETLSFTLQAVEVGMGPYEREAKGKPLPMTLYVRDAGTRADFTGPDGERALALFDSTRKEGWMISLDRGIAIPLKGGSVGDLLVDPANPCGHLPHRCQRGASRFVAGRPLDGWSYGDAEAHGPGGTSDGEFWIDPDSGVVLAYRGTKRGWRRVYEMTATSIRYGELPPELFTLPETVTLLDPDAKR